ncbi:hypothetical protein V5T12_10660, partial [Corynebacterium bovis]
DPSTDAPHPSPLNPPRRLHPQLRRAGLGTLTVLNSSVLGGLLLPVIVGPLIAAALFWTAASAQSRAKRVTAGLIATAFSTGFFLAAAAWLYMVVTVLGPIATMS